MFGEQTVRPIKNGLNALPPGQTGSLLTALNSDAVMYLSQPLGQRAVRNRKKLRDKNRKKLRDKRREEQGPAAAKHHLQKLTEKLKVKIKTTPKQ